MNRTVSSFHAALMVLIPFAWACTNVATQSRPQAPSPPVSAAPAPKREALPTPTIQSMLTTPPPGIAPLHHLGPPALYPSQGLTPGKADTLDAADLTRRYTEKCPRNKGSCTYSESHRYVPREVHEHVYDEYNVPDSERNSESGEVDHFWPLCASGSNDISNLWENPRGRIDGGALQQDSNIVGQTPRA